MTILMIAYSFPPASTSSTFRPMHFARYLQQMGDRIWVLTVREQDYPADVPQDLKLLEVLHPDITIVRSRFFHPRNAFIAFRDRLTGKKTTRSQHRTQPVNRERPASRRQLSWIQEGKDIVTDLLSTPDQQVGWLPFAVKTGLKIIKNHKIDVIYATGGPWTSLLVGSFLKKLTHRPLVMDFRDPWVTNPSPRSDSQVIRAIEPLIEQRVIACADHLVANTEELKQDFLQRYRHLREEMISEIPNGFEEYVDRADEIRSRHFTVIHAGTLYFSRNPKFLLQALLHLIQQSIIPQEEVRVIFLGGIAIEDSELDELLQHPLLEGAVEDIPRVPYQKAIDYQSRSDLLLLLQPDFPLQVPRKLYEYMAFRKPILGITNVQGATARVIREYELGTVAENQATAIESALRTYYEQWKDGSLHALSGEKCDRFLNKHLTRSLRQVLVHVHPASEEAA